jgi:hypothetical protein
MRLIAFWCERLMGISQSVLVPIEEHHLCAATR